MPTRQPPSNVIDFAAAALRHPARWRPAPNPAALLPSVAPELALTLRALEAKFGVRLVAYDPRTDGVTYGGAFLDELATRAF